jgi:penicillin-binding protein 1A
MLGWIAVMSLPLTAIFGLGAALAISEILAPDRDAFDRFALHRPAIASVVLDREGRSLGRFFVERRRAVALDEMPRHLVLAFLAAEDGGFYEHRGLDVSALLRAAWANLRHLEIDQGGSTITQQLVKNVLLEPERTWSRKLREMALALQIERRMGKDEILERYLNQIYLGSGAYGVGEAAWRYFGKVVDSLDLSESALLAGLTQRPSDYSPLANPAAAEHRRRYTLDRMFELGFISEAEHEAASGHPPEIRPGPEPEGQRIAGHFLEEVRRALTQRIGGAMLHEGGLVIETTLDLDFQRAAWRSLRAGLEEQAGRDAERPEGALVSLEVGSGDVLALVGGYDFDASPFDRATQAHRQPGSAFKPFVYAAAVAAGWSQASMLRDLPQRYWDPQTRSYWEPRNYNERFRGLATLREAFVRSLNNPTIELLRKVGVGRVRRLAERAGIRSPLEASLGVALGTSEVTLLELTRAYGVFPSGGRRLHPRFVRRVLDRDGRVLAADLELLEPAAPNAGADAPPASAQDSEPAHALDPKVAFVVADLLRGTIDEPDGTGHRAISLGRGIGGKTGTSDEYRDAWFVGFSQSIVTGVWVGFDHPRTLGRDATGGRAALPIWSRYMREAGAGGAARWPRPPPGVSYSRFDVDTGRQPDAATLRSYEGAFLAGTEPAVSELGERDAIAERRMTLLAEFAAETAAAR